MFSPPDATISTPSGGTSITSRHPPGPDGMPATASFRVSLALAVDTSGKAWIASRDTYNSYWLVSYTSSGVFGTWMPLLGIFSTDPVITSCGDGTIYLIGKDTLIRCGAGIIFRAPASRAGSSAEASSRASRRRPVVVIMRFM